MYLASGLPGPAQALPGPTHQAFSRPHQAHQALPGPTRPYPASASQKTTRWITYFFGSPQKHLQNDMFFLEPLENQKTQFYTVKCMFLLCSEGPKCQKTYILHCTMNVFLILE